MKLMARLQRMATAIRAQVGIGKHAFAFILIAMLAQSVAALATVQTLSDTFTALGDASVDTNYVYLKLALIVLLSLTGVGIYALRQRLTVAEKCKCHERLIRSCMERFRDDDNGITADEAYTIATGDCNALAEKGVDALLGYYKWMILLVVYSIYGLFISPALTILLMITELFTIRSVNVLSERLRQENADRRAEYGKWFKLLTGIADKMDACMTCISPQRLIDLLETRAFRWNDKSVASLDTLLRVDARFRLGRLLFEMVVVVCGLAMWRMNMMEIGLLYASIVTVQELCSLCEGVADVQDDLERCMVHADKLGVNGDARMLPDSDKHGAIPACTRCELTLSNVSFSYSTEKTVLSHIDRVFTSGNMYAICGASGCGKSTLLRLLAGFERIYSGNIRINGADYAMLDRDALWKRVQYSGAPCFIEGNFKDNVCFGLPFDAQRYAAATRNAGDMPARDKTSGNWISMNGDPLSSGERQMLLLCRTMYRHPNILLLDEPFANLSSEMEIEFIQSLKRELPGSCIIIATHRSETLGMYDEVLRLEGGVLT